MNLETPICVLSMDDTAGNKAWQLFPKENALAPLPVGQYVFRLKSPATLDSKAFILEQLKNLTVETDRLMEKLTGQPDGGIHPALETAWRKLDKATVAAFDKFKKVAFETDQPLRCYCPCHTVVQVKEAVGLLYGELESSEAGSAVEAGLEKEMEIGVLETAHLAHNERSTSNDPWSSKRPKMDACTVKLQRLENCIDRTQLSKFWIRYFNPSKINPPGFMWNTSVRIGRTNKRSEIYLKNHK